MKKFFLEEKISQDYKNKVFQIVKPELKKNRKAHIKKYFSILIPAFGCLVVAIIVGFYHVKQNAPFFDRESNVVVFPSHDVEFYENMDVIEHLDDIQSLNADTQSQDDSI